jgi:hypothetical protein
MANDEYSSDEGMTNGKRPMTNALGHLAEGVVDGLSGGGYLQSGVTPL